MYNIKSTINIAYVPIEKKKQLVKKLVDKNNCLILHIMNSLLSKKSIF